MIKRKSYMLCNTRFDAYFLISLQFLHRAFDRRRWVTDIKLRHRSACARSGVGHVEGNINGIVGRGGLRRDLQIRKGEGRVRQTKSEGIQRFDVFAGVVAIADENAFHVLNVGRFAAATGAA